MSRPSFRARRILEAEAAYADYLQRGFPTADFDGQPEPETLQCRDETDRTNWLGLVLECQAVISADPDAAAAPLPAPGIRCTSHRMYDITYGDALNRMFSLLGLVQQAQANLWRLKDEIAAAETGEALNAIDLTEGWP